jgi:hypothetical protein
MLPTFEEVGIRVFVRDRQGRFTNFGAPIRLDELIQVNMRPPETTKYARSRTIDVIGTFRIEPVFEDGEVFALYFIDDAEVIERQRSNRPGDDTHKNKTQP